MSKRPIKERLPLFVLFIGIITIFLQGSTALDRQSNPVHKSISCGECHASQISNDNNYSGPRLDRQCRDCHSKSDRAASPLAIQFHSDDYRNCLDCHSFHNPSKLAVGEKSFAAPKPGSVRATECATCHNENFNVFELSLGHQLATEIYHTDLPVVAGLSPSEKCLICHSNQADMSSLLEIPIEAPTFNEHASHPFGVVFNSKTEIKTNLIAGRIECQSCHSLGLQAPDLVMESHSNSSLCFDCHTEKLRQ